MATQSKYTQVFLYFQFNLYVLLAFFSFNSVSEVMFEMLIFEFLGMLFLSSTTLKYVLSRAQPINGFADIIS